MKINLNIFTVISLCLVICSCRKDTITQLQNTGSITQSQIVGNWEVESITLKEFSENFTYTENEITRHTRDHNNQTISNGIVQSVRIDTSFIDSTIGITTINAEGSPSIYAFSDTGIVHITSSSSESFTHRYRENFDGTVTRDDTTIALNSQTTTSSNWSFTDNGTPFLIIKSFSYIIDLNGDRMTLNIINDESTHRATGTSTFIREGTSERTMVLKRL